MDPKFQLLARDAVKEFLAAQVNLFVHQSTGGTEGIVELIYGQCCILAVVPKDDRRTVPTGDVDSSGSADGRREDEIADALEAKRFTTGLTRDRIEPAKHVLIMENDVKCFIVEQWRGNVGSIAFERPCNPVGC